MTINQTPSSKQSPISNFKIIKLVIGHWLLVIIWLLYLGNWSFADFVFIERIEQKRDRGYDYLDVYTTGWSEARGLLLEDKLYIDFPGARAGKKVKISRKISKRIKHIEVIQKDEKTARIVVTLKRTIDYDIVNVFGRDKSVVEIGDRLDNIFAKQIEEEKVLIKRKAKPLKPVKLEPVVTAAAPALRGKVIILDPGHGGDDPGASSDSGTPEKVLTLKTAQRAAELLREAGAKVYLTRNEDRRSNLQDVMEFANKTDADIFISIHYNSTYSSKISGSETYYYNPVSRRFAEAMHEAIVRGIGQRDRGLHRVRFYTVNHARMPSVLLEPVYLSNPEEKEMANSSSFRERLAAAIVKGVKRYFRNNSD
jgi:N-acetylmuramoyl-L-alanine amidase